MLSRHEHRGIVWVDLESPSRDEVKTVMEEFGIEAFVAQELIMPSARPRSDFYSKYIFLVLHFPALKKGHRQREQGREQRAQARLRRAVGGDAVASSRRLMTVGAP